MDNKIVNQENNLLENIKDIISKSRIKLYKSINKELIETYWKIGKTIVDNEIRNHIDSKSARQIVLNLSRELTFELGKGFSRSNLFNMRKLYNTYPDVQTVSGHLSWSHLCELITIEDANKRSFYEKESINSSWSYRELKRQVDSSLFERLILSEGKNNKDKVIELSKKGQVIEKPLDLIKNPYVFEFIGLKENKPILEKDLEKKLIRHIEDFLLELGRGFMYVGSQQRITINNTHYYVDMVFYNKILKSYILLELKTRKLQISDGGQLNTYLNYYKTEVNEPTDNEPIGIILCAEKDEIAAEYILGGFDNNVFASKYTYILPSKEELIEEVENLIND